MRDRRGLEEEDCSLDYEEDDTIDPGCCLPTAWWSGGEEDFACSAGGGTGGGGGGSSPPCWQDINRQGETLEDLAENIYEIENPNLTSSEIDDFNFVIQSAISVEAAALSANISSGSSTPPSSYNGGHYNLIVSTGALQAALGTDYANFAMDFGGRLDGTRQAAVYGNPAQGNFTLHSKEHGQGAQDHYSFHFDLYNPLSGNPLNFLGHVFGDVIGGNLGSPCLDPAWR